MRSSVLATTGWATRKLLVALGLGAISLFVGVGLVVLPQGAPFGVVGLAALLLFWTLPDLKTVPVRLARRFFLPMLFTTFSVPFYLAIVIPGVPLISLRRFVLYIFVGALLITICASSQYRRLLLERARAAPVLYYAIAGYCALALVTLPISSAPAVAINSVIQSTMLWLLPLCAAVLFIETTEDVLRIFKLVLACMFLNCLIGAVEFRIQHPVLWQLLPAGTRAYIIANYPLYAGMETGGFRDGVYRAISTYTVGLSWAEMVAMASPFAAYYIAHGKSGWQRLFGAAAFAACVLSLALAGSRGGYVSTIGATSVYVLIWAFRQVRLHPESLFGSIVLFLGTLAVAVVMAAITFVNKFHIMIFGGGQTQVSNQGRELEWAAAMPKIYASPIWGHGFGTAGTVVNYVTGYGQGSLDDGRINLLVDSGVIGFTLFVAAVAAAVWICFQVYISNKSMVGSMGASIGCSLIAYCIFRTGLSQTDNNSFFYVLLGIAWTIQRLAKQNESQFDLRREPSMGITDNSVGNIMSEPAGASYESKLIRYRSRANSAYLAPPRRHHILV